jgi:hypothetical protein
VFITLAIGPTFDPYSNTTTDVLRQLEAGSMHECLFLRTRAMLTNLFQNHSSLSPMRHRQGFMRIAVSVHQPDGEGAPTFITLSNYDVKSSLIIIRQRDILLSIPAPSMPILSVLGQCGQVIILVRGSI